MRTYINRSIGKLMGLQPAARCHICKLCIYVYFKNFTEFRQVHHLHLFFHVPPANQPTITGVAFSPKEFGDPICR